MKHKLRVHIARLENETHLAKKPNRLSHPDPSNKNPCQGAAHLLYDSANAYTPGFSTTNEALTRMSHHPFGDPPSIGSYHHRWIKKDSILFLKMETKQWFTYKDKSLIFHFIYKHHPSPISKGHIVLPLPFFAKMKPTKTLFTSFLSPKLTYNTLKNTLFSFIKYKASHSCHPVLHILSYFLLSPTFPLLLAAAASCIYTLLQRN